MKNFDDRFNKIQDEFDRDWKTMRRLGCASALVNFIVVVGLAVFVVWVIVRLMMHFGVI